jgi:hypothetical protein
MERKRFLTAVVVVFVCTAILSGATSVRGQVAGTSTIGISAEQVKLVALGWSAKKKILG